MRLRRRQPGDYSGLALYTIEGLWVVSVSQYTGWNNKDGYVWRSIPAEGFFRLDGLGRPGPPLQASGIIQFIVYFKR
jgi:hypothetical protein